MESFDPADCYTEDGEPFECEILEDEYVTINGEKYPCHRLYDDWNNEKWTADKGFFYK